MSGMPAGHIITVLAGWYGLRVVMLMERRLKSISLSKEERETHIYYNEADPIATVEVPVPSSSYRRLVKMGDKPINSFDLKGQVVSAVFQVEKERILIKSLRKITPEEMVARRERAKRNFCS